MKRVYVALLAVGLLFGGVIAVAIARHRPAKAATVQLNPEEHQLFTATNHIRGADFLPAYNLDPGLCEAARLTANAMAADRKFYLPPKSAMAERIRESGYSTTDWAVNTNIAKDVQPPRESVSFFMKNEESGRNIRSRLFQDIGVAIAQDTDGKFYVVQVFAKPRP